MNETIKRALAGVVYILIIAGSVIAGEKTLILVFLILGIISIYELQRLLKFKNLIGYLLLASLLYSLTNFPTYFTYVYLLIPFVLLVKILLLKDLFSKKDFVIISDKKPLISWLYIVPSFLFLCLLPSVNGTYQPYLLIGFFVLIWVNDSFAYLIGKNFGKHKLFQRVSPKKTFEGFFGGLIASLIFGYIIYTITDLYNIFVWFGIALIVWVTGSLGDLVQSKFKRVAKVKDSGSIMPGHGGVFDRMDSTIFSITFVYTFLLIIEYVS
ncbi:phosphatidate cytidylyltransferase [Psychroflexus salis]|uniref:Phosphatidate cytidylyltransferase n=1 Tax=Psychroflexus salis TaxID=1526574 RepID=A0A916ZSS8_9FLAO|nr:phosphatidate cytidylyltransferase [Psychroflexus salis]GGE09655.1 phosphatidate cytidylyltransferase [Psychroflexus salis]